VPLGRDNLSGPSRVLYVDEWVGRPVMAKQMIPSRMQEGLREAFEVHYLPILRLCTLISGRKEVAEDMVQDAFARVAPFIERLSPDEVGPYLRRVTLNSWKNRLRRSAIEQRARAILWPQNQSDPFGTVEDRESLWRCVMRLPERQRTCLVLRYYEDLPHQEIARILGCSLGTVKSHLARALDRLRREYGHRD
jgi:RNA polymerase sigma-70 factor (sigma-E family)